MEKIQSMHFEFDGMTFIFHKLFETLYVHDGLQRIILFKLCKNPLALEFSLL